MKYYHSTKLKGVSFEKTLEIVKEALQKEGFGVLTEIDVKATFKKKLDKDFKEYRILGACNPHFAFKAISAEDKIGVFLPCNVLVEEAENDTIEVSAVDPMSSMMSVENEELGPLAAEVQEKMKKVIADIAGK